MIDNDQESARVDRIIMIRVTDAISRYLLDDDDENILQNTNYFY